MMTVHQAQEDAALAFLGAGCYMEEEERMAVVEIIQRKEGEEEDKQEVEATEKINVDCIEEVETSCFLQKRVETKVSEEIDGERALVPFVDKKESQVEINSVMQRDINSMMQRDDENGEWVCILCGKQDRKRSYLSEHIESCHTGCSLCQRKFDTRKGLTVHKFRKHKILTRESLENKKDKGKLCLEWEGGDTVQIEMNNVAKNYEKKNSSTVETDKAIIAEEISKNYLEIDDLLKDSDDDNEEDNLATRTLNVAQVTKNKLIDHVKETICTTEGGSKDKEVCFLCQISVPDKNRLEAHLKTGHGVLKDKLAEFTKKMQPSKNNGKCRICDFSSESPYKIEIHYKERHNVKNAIIYKQLIKKSMCSICRTEVVLLEDHYKTVHRIAANIKREIKNRSIKDESDEQNKGTSLNHQPIKIKIESAEENVETAAAEEPFEDSLVTRLATSPLVSISQCFEELKVLLPSLPDHQLRLRALQLFKQVRLVKAVLGGAGHSSPYKRSAITVLETPAKRPKLIPDTVEKTNGPTLKGPEEPQESNLNSIIRPDTIDEVCPVPSSSTDTLKNNGLDKEMLEHTNKETKAEAAPASKLSPGQATHQETRQQTTDEVAIVTYLFTSDETKITPILKPKGPTRSTVKPVIKAPNITKDKKQPNIEESATAGPVHPNPPDIMELPPPPRGPHRSRRSRSPSPRDLVTPSPTPEHLGQHWRPYTPSNPNKPALTPTPAPHPAPAPAPAPVYPCSECPAVEPSMRGYLPPCDHIRNVHRMTKGQESHPLRLAFKCEECEFSCKVETDLMVHVMVRHVVVKKGTVEEILFCDYCDFTSKDKDDYENHIEMGHDEEDRATSPNDDDRPTSPYEHVKLTSTDQVEAVVKKEPEDFVANLVNKLTAELDSDEDEEKEMKRSTEESHSENLKQHKIEETLKDLVAIKQEFESEDQIYVTNLKNKLAAFDSDNEEEDTAKKCKLTTKQSTKLGTSHNPENENLFSSIDNLLSVQVNQNQSKSKSNLENATETQRKENEVINRTLGKQISGARMKHNLKVRLAQSKYFQDNPNTLKTTDASFSQSSFIMDPNLPPGWRVRVIPGEGKKVFYLSPENMLIRSSFGVLEYLNCSANLPAEQIKEISIYLRKTSGFGR